MNKGKIYISQKDEWYTPKYIVDMFGKFDTDPATTKENAERLNIPNYFTKETNGLKNEWIGKVWCNPPFSIKDDFIKKAREYTDKTGNKVFMLLPLSAETKIWHQCILGKSIIHIPNKRINFMNDEFKKVNTPPFTSVIVEFTKEKNNTYKTFKI